CRKSWNLPFTFARLRHVFQEVLFPPFPTGFDGSIGLWNNGPDFVFLRLIRLKTSSDIPNFLARLIFVSSFLKNMVFFLKSIRSHVKLSISPILMPMVYAIRI